MAAQSLVQGIRPSRRAPARVTDVSDYADDDDDDPDQDNLAVYYWGPLHAYWQ